MSSTLREDAVVDSPPTLPKSASNAESGEAQQTITSTPQVRSYSSSSTSTTPSNSPLFYASNYNSGNIDYIPTDRITLLDLLDPMATLQQTTNSLSKRYNRVKEKSINRIQKLKNDTSTERLKQRLNERIDKFDQRLNKLFYASSTEKVFYAFGMWSIFMGGFVIGRYPEHFHQLYTVLSVILLPIRIYTYWKKTFQYFLADLCYFVNACVLTFIWIAPHSSHLYIVCFAFTHGTLAWAVVTWRNSLVLHSIDKYTSSFIHIAPPAVMFVITHMLPMDYKMERFPGAAKVTSWNFFSGILWTSLYYLVWQSLYHYFITLKRAEKIKAGRATSFEWLRRSFAKAWLGRFVNSLPDPFPVVAFTFIQYGYQLLTMSICPIWFTYKHAAGAFLTFIFLTASYNGATYYIDFYGKRMEKEVQKLQREIREMQASGELFGDSSDNLQGLVSNDIKEDQSKKAL